MSKAVYGKNLVIGLTEPVRVLFPPSLLTPRQVNNTGDAKYEIQIGFPKDHPDYKLMKDESVRIAREKWGPDVDLKKLDFKFKSGDAEYEAALNPTDPAKKPREYSHLQNLIVMKLRSAKKPIAVRDARKRDAQNRPLLITDESEIISTIYPGCFVAVKMVFATYNAVNRGNAGVTAYPEEVCFVRDGERLAFGNDDQGEAFAAVQGVITDENPYGDDDPLAGL